MRAHHPDLALCLSTNGLALPGLVDAFVRCGVSHLTVTVNAVDPGIATSIYRWVRDGEDVLRGEEAARLILARQAEGIALCVKAGMTVKVNSVLLPGINDEHLPAVAERVHELGASFMNLIPLRPVPGTALAAAGAPAHEAVTELRRRIHKILPVLSHCGQCRADAAGRIGAPNDSDVAALLADARTVTGTSQPRPHVAVASQEGVFVNSHLGHAREMLVYAETPDAFELVDVRPAPLEGRGEARWQELAEVLADCRAVVAAEAGATPERALGASGIRVLCTEGLIEDALERIFGGNEDSLRPPSCRSGTACGSKSGGGRAGASCSGGGGLCG